ncbi:MAG: DNA-3-methyladenine glycosylase [Chloroflexota bacterium]
MVTLPRSFYTRPARVVAHDLLGKKLVRCVDSCRTSGLIVEAEAYCDAEQPDLACHGDRANQGRPTNRTAIMFGPAGHAYVYFTYGMHWMFNVVTGETGRANAVLIRALQPLEGEKWMAQRRGGRPRALWTNGPARLAQALAIDGSLDGVDLCQPDGPIWLEDGPAPAAADVAVGPRIGLGRTPEPWRSIPWRYWWRGNPFVSKP